MNSKTFITSILLLVALLFCSCSIRTESSQGTETVSSEKTELSTKEPDDPFLSVRASGEEWIAYGLKAYESGKQVENLKSFFCDSANLTYLTLYDYFFTYDKAKSVPVAEAFFSFVVDEFGVEALSDIEKRCEYKNAYLKSLGLEGKYGNSPIVEAFFAAMDFSSDASCKYVMSFDNVTYYFKDFGAGSPQQYHGFLYYSTVGLRSLTEYLHNNGLDEGLDTSRNFNFYMTFDGSNYSKTVYQDGNMYINDSYSTLHEAMHAMGVKKDSDIWLSEGICNYFGKALGFNEQIAAADIQILAMAASGYFDARAKAGDKSALLYKAIYDDYTAHGGKIDSIEGLDLRLYFDVSAKAELDSLTYVTLGDVYKTVNKKECYSVGKELSNNQATSMIAYLADRYGIVKVMEAYRATEPKTVFGKDYDNLKTEWLAYLCSLSND